MVTWRQHAHVMSHTDSRAKFVDYLQMRTDRNNPALQLQLKANEKATKLLMRETAAREKAEVAARDKVTKESQKAAERERRQRLSPAEKKAEIAERKLEISRRKAALLLQNDVGEQDAAIAAEEEILDDQE